jgi:hypothetical protein
MLAELQSEAHSQIDHSTAPLVEHVKMRKEVTPR